MHFCLASRIHILDREAIFMEKLLNTADSVNACLNRFVWGPVMLFFFLFIGLLFSFGTGFFQIRKFRLWMKCTFFSLFRQHSSVRSGSGDGISQFQSVCTALAATLGIGNIAGVATALVLGGPGAVFWMWVSAFLGMMTAYAENVLGIRYRCRNSANEWTGGPMVYLEKGLHCRPLAVLFCLFCILASLGMGNMAQANSIASGLQDAFGISPWMTGCFFVILIILVILGGIQRISRVAEFFVPAAALAYILCGILVILKNHAALLQALALIFREAFAPSSAAAGALGYGMKTALRRGISRGVFSNEAGLGSSVIVHCAADTDDPVLQGMWSIFEIFADTMIMCTVTALAILTSKVYDKGICLQQLAAGQEPVSGTALTGRAFASVLPHGSQFVALSVILFAFSTILGWSYFGERCASWLFGPRAVLPYKLLFLACIFPGCIIPLNLVWEISDTFNGLMALPNLIGLLFLSPEVFSVTRKYFM